MENFLEDLGFEDNSKIDANDMETNELISIWKRINKLKNTWYNNAEVLKLANSDSNVTKYISNLDISMEKYFNALTDKLENLIADESRKEWVAEFKINQDDDFMIVDSFYNNEKELVYYYRKAKLIDLVVDINLAVNYKNIFAEFQMYSDKNNKLLKKVHESHLFADFLLLDEKKLNKIL